MSPVADRPGGPPLVGDGADAPSAPARASDPTRLCAGLTALPSRLCVSVHRGSHRPSPSIPSTHWPCGPAAQSGPCWANRRDYWSFCAPFKSGINLPCGRFGLPPRASRTSPRRSSSNCIQAIRSRRRGRDVIQAQVTSSREPRLSVGRRRVANSTRRVPGTAIRRTWPS